MALVWVPLLPVVVLFVVLIPLRRPAYEAAPLAYLVALILAVVVWQIPGAALVASLINTAVVFVEVFLIITVALLVLNVMIETGRLDGIKAYIAGVSGDHRVLAMLLAWGLVCFIEGIAGFGTPAVLAAPLLVYFGLKPLKAVTAALVGNSTAVPFGAAGTPVVIGFAGLGLSEQEVSQAVAQAALMHGLSAIFLTGFIAWVVTLGEEKGRFREFLPFAIFSALAFSVPYVLVAYLIGPELPSIIGGLVAITAITVAAQRRFLLPTRQPAEPERGGQAGSATGGELLRSFAPFLVMAIALIVSRTVPAVRGMLQDVTFSFGQFRGVELDQTLSPLYTPYFYFALALVTALLVFRVQRGTLRAAAVSTYRKVRVASIVLVFIIALTQLLLLSELNQAGLPSMPAVVGEGLAQLLGGGFVIFSAFVGALGSFMTGSATVSNLLFAGLQVDTARALDITVPALLALQLVGAGVGNMISLHNIAMAAGAVGLKAREGEVIRETIIPVLVISATAGLVLYLL